MRRASNAIEVLRRQGETLKKILESLPEDEWVVSEEDATISLGDRVVVTYRKTTAEALLRYIEDTNRLGMVDALKNLLKTHIKSYKIQVKGRVIDSETVPKNERVDFLMKSVHPSLFLWIVTEILPQVPMPTTEEEIEEIQVE